MLFRVQSSSRRWFGLKSNGLGQLSFGLGEVVKSGLSGVERNGGIERVAYWSTLPFVPVAVPQ